MGGVIEEPCEEPVRVSRYQGVYMNHVAVIDAYTLGSGFFLLTRPRFSLIDFPALMILDAFRYRLLPL